MRERNTSYNNRGTNPIEDITIVNMYTPNIGAPKYIKQILTDIKEEIESNKIRVRVITHHLHQ